MDRITRLDRNRGWKEISIVLTDNAGIRLINQRHLAQPEVTDVISFRYDPIPGDNDLFSAEIIVNVQRAAEACLPRELASGRREGPRVGRLAWSESRELALYIAHGCNHLAGETDYDKAGRTRMRRRELRWLKQAEELGLIGELIYLP